MNPLARAALAVLALTLVACSRDTPLPRDSHAGGGRVTRVEHFAGVTEVVGTPGRIVTLSPLASENLFALDMHPVAMTEFSIGNPSQPHVEVPPYLAHLLRGVPLVGNRNAPDLEAVLSHAPDLIVGVDDHGSRYDALRRISPTVLFSQTEPLTRQDLQPWRASLLTLGRLTDREDRAVARLAEYDAAAARARDRLSERIDGETVLLVRTLAKGVRIHGRAHATMGHILYEDLGLAPPPALPPDTEAEFVAMEKLVDLDPDHLLIIEGHSGVTSELVRGPVWSRLRAVRSGRVHRVDLYWIRGHGWFGKMAIVADAERLLAGGE